MLCTSFSMLNYVTVNIFDSPAQTLVNTVNTVGVMGKGIAAEFKQRYPDMFRKYREHCRSGALTVGKLYLYKSPNKWVLNFPTKQHWRNPSKLEYLEAGLAKFVETYSATGITSISFPQLGTGNGGLDWEVVRPMMHEYLRRLPIPVYVHTALPPSGFVPEHLGKLAKRELRAPRAAISFPEFFHDVQEIADAIEPPTHVGEADEPEPLAQIRVASHLFRGEDFATLWYDLRTRGALRVEEFPPQLAEHSASVTELLFHLGYIRPIGFASGNGAGIRFAPSASQDDLKTSDLTLHREELD